MFIVVQFTTMSSPSSSKKRSASSILDNITPAWDKSKKPKTVEDARIAIMDNPTIQVWSVYGKSESGMDEKFKVRGSFSRVSAWVKHRFPGGNMKMETIADPIMEITESELDSARKQTKDLIARRKKAGLSGIGSGKCSLTVFDSHYTLTF